MNIEYEVNLWLGPWKKIDDVLSKKENPFITIKTIDMASCGYLKIGSGKFVGEITFPYMSDKEKLEALECVVTQAQNHNAIREQTLLAQINELKESINVKEHETWQA